LPSDRTALAKKALGMSSAIATVVRGSRVQRLLRPDSKQAIGAPVRNDATTLVMNLTMMAAMRPAVKQVVVRLRGLLVGVPISKACTVESTTVTVWVN
jgi:hypothetical protein